MRPLRLLLPAAPLVMKMGVTAILCGFPSPAQDYATDDLDLTEHLIRDAKNTWFWEAIDYSMVDAGIFDTSVLVVDRGLTPVPGDIVIVLIDGEHQARRLSTEHGVPALRSEGLGHQLHYGADLDIWGVVTWILTPLSRRHELLEGALAGVDIGKLLIRDRASSYLWRAAGGSMTGAGICDGSLLVVDRGIRPEDGSIIIIAIVDNEHTVKRLDLSGPSPLLRADNPSHPDILLAELSELTVWGTVTWSITKARVGRRG